MHIQPHCLRGLGAAALLIIAGTAAAGPLSFWPSGATPAAVGSVAGDGPWQVTGVTSGGTLEMRAGPATGYSVVAKVPNGEVLHNQGCGTRSAVLWCRVETLDRGTSGWVAAAALRAVPGPVGVTPEPPGLQVLEGGVLETSFANGCTVRHDGRGARILESISCLRTQLTQADTAARAYLRGKR